MISRPRQLESCGVLAALALVIAMGPSPSAASESNSTQESSVEQRAYAEWTRGSAGYFADGFRGRLGSRVITLGFVGRSTCPIGSGPGPVQTCVGASRGHRIPAENLTIDPTLSSSTLRLSAFGSRQVIDWTGEGAPEPYTEPDRSGSGIAREASAEGRVLGASVDTNESQDAELRQEADSDDLSMPGAIPIPEVAPASTTATFPTNGMASGSSSSNLDTAQFAATRSRCFSFKRSERRFARLMNGARSARSHNRMKIDRHLTRVARVHTNEMVKRHSLYHTSSEALGRRVTRWRVLGENVGFGGSVRSLHHAFMESPAHRDNILFDSYRHVGVGVKQSKGLMWVTVVFEASKDPGTRLAMPSC